MAKINDPDSELFFWIKRGQEKNEDSIHSIHNTKSRINPKKAPTKTSKNQSDTKRAGLKPGWTRASFIVKEDNLMKIKALAYWERKDIKQIMDEAISDYLEGKKVKPIPKI